MEPLLNTLCMFGVFSVKKGLFAPAPHRRAIGSAPRERQGCGRCVRASVAATPRLWCCEIIKKSICPMRAPL